jgi:hypothetical protein
MPCGRTALWATGHRCPRLSCPWTRASSVRGWLGSALGSCLDLPAQELVAIGQEASFPVVQKRGAPQRLQKSHATLMSIGQHAIRDSANMAAGNVEGAAQ